jgi:hypothetical protein
MLAQQQRQAAVGAAAAAAARRPPGPRCSSQCCSPMACGRCKAQRQPALVKQQVLLAVAPARSGNKSGRIPHLLLILL